MTLTHYQMTNFKTGHLQMTNHMWLKAFADDKSNVAEKFKLPLERVENIVGKGENAGYHNVF